MIETTFGVETPLYRMGASLNDSLNLGYVVGDSDLTLKIGNTPLPTNGPNDLYVAGMYSEDNNTTLIGARTADVNPNGKTGTIIMVAASTSDTTPDDFFKISKLSICATKTCPPPWKDCDLGSCKLGSCTYYNYCHTVCGSGDDIWNNNDSCHYEWQPAGGDCSIIVRCTGIGNTDPWAKAGCMIRETLNGDSKHASCFVTPANGCAFQWAATRAEAAETRTAARAVRAG